MLSMIIMWITITIYFDFSHVSIYSLFISSSSKFKCLMLTWWTYRVQSGNTDGIRGLEYEEGYEHINRRRNKMCTNMEKEGNAYTSLDTHTQELE